MVQIDSKYPSQQSEGKQATSKSLYTLALVLFFVNLANIGFMIYMLISAQVVEPLFGLLFKQYLANTLAFIICTLCSVLLCFLSRGVVKNSSSRSLIALNAVLLVAVIVTIIVFSV